MHLASLFQILPRSYFCNSPSKAGWPRVLTSDDQLLAKQKIQSRCLSWYNQAALQFIPQCLCAFCLTHAYWSRPSWSTMMETIFAHKITCTKAIYMLFFILWLDSPGLEKAYLLIREEIQLVLLRWVAVVSMRSWWREQPTLCGEAGQA